MNMNLSELKTLDEVIEEQRRDDPAFAEAWDRLAYARAVALRVIAYRVEHSLSQTGLARLVGIVQPQIARLEAADHPPRIETLVKLSRATGLRFDLAIGDGGVELRTA
jgi:DNA-binding XRE family transcriptional regulator